MTFQRKGVSDMEKKKRRQRCSQCGELKESTFKSNDPYIDEIHPESENPETIWCKQCYQDACDDI